MSENEKRDEGIDDDLSGEILASFQRDELRQKLIFWGVVAVGTIAMIAIMEIAGRI